MVIPDLFEALYWSIIGQQINLIFAYKLKRIFTEVYGTKLTFEGINYHLFSKPEIVANIKVEDLLPFQFSNRKAEYISLKLPNSLCWEIFPRKSCQHTQPQRQSTCL